MTENEIATQILDSSLKIHRALGPGLLESVYEEALVYELSKKKIQYKRQFEIPVFYDNHELGIGFRADLIVQDKVIVELKSVETIQPVHKKQLLTYLKITGIKLGLLLNFNESLLRDGITRIVNGL